MKRILFLMAVLFAATMCLTANTPKQSGKTTASTEYSFQSHSSDQSDVLAKVRAERWVKNRLKDPKSYQLIEWKAQRCRDDYNTYVVYLKFRARNSFNGYVVQEAVVAIYNFGSYRETMDGIIQ